MMENRLLKFYVLVLLLASCSPDRADQSKVVEMPVPHVIFGTWYSTNYQGSYSKIINHDKDMDPGFSGWPDIFPRGPDQSDQIAFSFSQIGGHESLQHGDFIEGCELKGIVWAPWVTNAYRDFDVICSEIEVDQYFGTRKLHLTCFGDVIGQDCNEVKPRNFRIFGQKFGLMRLKFWDGNTYYFKRVK